MGCVCFFFESQGCFSSDNDSVNGLVGVGRSVGRLVGGWFMYYPMFIKEYAENLSKKETFCTFWLDRPDSAGRTGKPTDHDFTVFSWIESLKIETETRVVVFMTISWSYWEYRYDKDFIVDLLYMFSWVWRRFRNMYSKHVNPKTCFWGGISLFMRSLAWRKVIGKTSSYVFSFKPPFFKMGHVFSGHGSSAVFFSPS